MPLYRIPTEGQQPVKVYKPVTTVNSAVQLGCTGHELKFDSSGIHNKKNRRMNRHQDNLITVIRRSCLTGNAVWLYRGPSANAARMKYWRAANKEVERVRNWSSHVSVRTANIIRLQTECMNQLPINAEIPPSKSAAAKRLQAMAKLKESCYLEFFNHIMEERRRKKKDREIRRSMGLREN